VADGSTYVNFNIITQPFGWFSKQYGLTDQALIHCSAKSLLTIRHAVSTVLPLSALEYKDQGED
jgi:hypothetical protein